MKISDPTKRQKEVIQYMRDGYELGRSTHFTQLTWLQLGGCGNGGKSVDISKSTFKSLYTKGLIQQLQQRPFEQPKRYKLTELGKTIQL